jgi:hypothetical protein
MENSSSVIDNPFDDVNSDDWFYDDVICVYNNSLMTGTSAFPMLFSPNIPLTRGMIVTILYRDASAPNVTEKKNPFDDVADNAFYTDAVKWAVLNGITYGRSNRRFAPKDDVTRQDLAVMLARYIEWTRWMKPPLMREYRGFDDDAEIASYAREAVEFCYRTGIINGKPGNRFDPTGQATRAEVAAILRSMMETG